MRDDRIESGVVEVRGVALRHHRSGRGIPTLVVGSAVYYPRVFSAHLRRQLQLICVDHRGFVAPTGAQNAAPCDLDALASDLEQMRQALGLARVVVMGHSGHGAMALHYAKKYPQHVSHVVMICSGPNNSPASHAAADRYLAESVCPERKAWLAERLAELPAALEAAPERRFATCCLKLGARAWYDHTYDATSMWRDVPLNMPILDHVWGQVLRDADVRAGLESLQVPVLLALGRYDFMVAPPHTWDPLRPAFADLTVRVFEKSGHLPPLEEPAAFDAELLTWLNRPVRASAESGLAAVFS